MLGTIFLLGLFVLLGIIALKIVFGILGGVVTLLLWLLWQVVVILVIGFVVYIVIRILSPETARRIRSKLGGSEY